MRLGPDGESKPMIFEQAWATAVVEQGRSRSTGTALYLSVNEPSPLGGGVSGKAGV